VCKTKAQRGLVDVVPGWNTACWQPRRLFHMWLGSGWDRLGDGEGMPASPVQSTYIDSVCNQWDYSTTWGPAVCVWAVETRVSTVGPCGNTKNTKRLSGFLWCRMYTSCTQVWIFFWMHSRPLFNFFMNFMTFMNWIYLLDVLRRITWFKWRNMPKFIKTQE